MTEQVGSIEYSVSAETDGLLKAEKTATTSIDKIGKSFGRADTAVIKNSNQIKKSAKEVEKALAATSRKVGQTSIQFQQLFGQIQGGQDPLNAFAAQIADIGIVTGFAFSGAIAGIAASLGGILLPSLFDSKSATEKLEKAMESLNKVASDSDGIKVFSQDIADLAKVSESAARLVLVAAEQTSKEAGKAAAKGIGEEFNDSFDVSFFQKSFDSLKSIAGTAGGTGYSISKEYRELGERFGLTGEAARKAGISVLVSLRDMEQAVSSNAPDAGEKIVAFQEKLADLSTTAKGENRTKLLTFVSSISDYIKKAKEASEISKALSDALKDNGLDLTTEKTKKHVEESDRLVSSLNAQFIALGQGEEAAFRFATAQQLGLEVGEQIPENIDAQISALFRLKKAQDDARIAKQEADKADREKKSLASRVSGVGLSPEDVLQDRFAKEAELLRAAREQEILTESEFLTRKLELNKQHEEALLGLRAKTNESAILNFESLQNQIVGTFASVAIGAQDGEEAVRSLAKSVLTELVGALIKQGIQTALNGTLSDVLKTKTIGNIVAVTAADTASKAISTKTSVAQSATVATAAAPAAALTSTYSFGKAALIGGAAILGTLALVKAASGRQYGGPVNNGSMYRVGENGPEIFSSGGKNFMIPGQNGTVIPNNEINNGGSTNNSVALTLNIDPRSPEEFGDQLVRNAPLLVNLVEKAINDRGRSL